MCLHGGLVSKSSTQIDLVRRRRVDMRRVKNHVTPIRHDKTSYQITTCQYARARCLGDTNPIRTTSISDLSFQILIEERIWKEGPGTEPVWTLT